MRSTLLAATALSVMAGMEAISQSMPVPRKGSSRDYRQADIERAFARNERPAPGPEEAKRAAVRAEMAAHNAEVDRRKAEKRARKLARRIAGPNVRAQALPEGEACRQSPAATS